MTFQVLSFGSVLGLLEDSIVALCIVYPGQNFSGGLHRRPEEV